jgi:O-antigen ligase
MTTAAVIAGNHSRNAGGLAVAAGGGTLIGLMILVATGSSLKWVLVLTAVSCLPVMVLVLGSLTRTIQALLIFSLSMTLDIFLGYSDRFVETRPGVPVSLTAILLLCLYGLAVIGAGHAGARFRRPHAATISFGLFVIWAGLSLLVAPRPGYALQALPGYFTSLLIYLYALRLMSSVGHIRFTSTWIALAVVVSGALGCVQYVTGGFPSLSLLGGSETQFVQGYANEQISRVSGLLHHPNTFAVFLNGFVPLLLVLAFTLTERPLRLLCGAAAGLGTLALLLTYSRGGWLSFGVSVVVLMLVIPRKEWRPGLGMALLTVVSLSLLLIAVIATPLYSRVVTRLEGDDQGAAQSRTALARMSLVLIGEHPFVGAGLGNYQFASPVVTDDRGVPLIEAGDGRPMRVHNLLLFTAVELGIPGAVLLTVTIGLFLARAVSVIRHGTRLAARVGLGLTAGLLAILIHCMLEPATLADPSYLVLSFVGGCVTGLADRSASDG